MGCKEHAKVVSYLDKILKQEQIIINTVVIIEVAHYLIKNLGFAGKEKVNILLNLPFKVIDFDYEQVKQSVNFLDKFSTTGTGIGGRDATLLAAMAKAGTNSIVTNDSSFNHIKGIKVINPITR